MNYEYLASLLSIIEKWRRHSLRSRWIRIRFLVLLVAFLILSPGFALVLFTVFAFILEVSLSVGLLAFLPLQCRPKGPELLAKWRDSDLSCPTQHGCCSQVLRKLHEKKKG
jgi:hypothetical protein